MTHHTGELKNKMDDLVNTLRRDTRESSEPREKALFETSAEVILGLKKAIEDYENKMPAWR